MIMLALAMRNMPVRFIPHGMPAREADALLESIDMPQETTAAAKPLRQLPDENRETMLKSYGSNVVFRWEIAEFCMFFLSPMLGIALYAAWQGMSQLLGGIMAVAVSVALVVMVMRRRDKAVQTMLARGRADGYNLAEYLP